MRSKRVEFAAPEGAVPEGIAANEEFDAVCTFRVKEGTGDLCLVKLGDTEMPGYDEKAGGESRKTGYKDAAEDMVKSNPMPQQSQQPAY